MCSGTKSLGLFFCPDPYGTLLAAWMNWTFRVNSKWATHASFFIHLLLSQTEQQVLLKIRFSVIFLSNHVLGLTAGYLILVMFLSKHFFFFERSLVWIRSQLPRSISAFFPYFEGRCTSFLPKNFFSCAYSLYVQPQHTQMRLVSLWTITVNDKFKCLRHHSYLTDLKNSFSLRLSKKRFRDNMIEDCK